MPQRPARLPRVLRQRITEFGPHGRLRLANLQAAGIAVDDRGSARKNEVRITRGMLASGHHFRNVDHDGASVSRPM